MTEESSAVAPDAGTEAPGRVRLLPGVASRIAEHGRSAYPHECCGALIGTGDTVRDILPLPNVTDEGPRRRFRVSDRDYRAAETAASNAGAELLGFYHSHPDHPARPSQYDLDHAWPFFRYVIVSVREGVPGEMTTWRLRDDRSAFVEETLVDADTEEK